MKSIKKTAVIMVCLIAIFAGQNLAAASYLPADGQDSFSLEEVYYLNSAMLNSDMLQFMQVYMYPDDPLTFYQQAAKWTDEEIETNAYYYFSFVYSQIAGKIPFYYFSNLEEYIAVTEQDVGEGPFQVYENITTFDDLKKIYPSGIVYCNPYDMLRTTARQMVYYIALQSEDGQAPSAAKAQEILDYLFQQIQQQYTAAMEAEAAAAEAAAAATDTTTAAATDAAAVPADAN
jgi:hypothetical protein